MSRSITAPSGTEPLLGTLVNMLVPPFLWYGCQCRWASTEQAVRRTKGCFAGELVGFWVGNFLEHVAVEGFLCQPLSMSGCIVGERVEATARAPLGTVKVLATLRQHVSLSRVPFVSPRLSGVSCHHPVRRSESRCGHVARIIRGPAWGWAAGTRGGEMQMPSEDIHGVPM